MYEHREKCLVPAMLGVGAAFDFNSGRLRGAPSWVGDRGLEWLFPACLWNPRDCGNVT
jgi:N-acetylglucosaminyldiphosphoundecaprenol N-acetyl-beta-D-mannosaminyltransferase